MHNPASQFHADAVLLHLDYKQDRLTGCLHHGLHHLHRRMHLPGCGP